MVKKYLEKYAAARHDILNFFDFKETWQCFPIENMTDQHWFITKYKIVFMTEAHFFNKASVEIGHDISSAVIVSEPIIKDDYTLILGDTQTDNNVFIMIFDNSKKCEDKDIIDLYNKHWG